MKDNQKGFLGSFLSKGLKTNQLEVNTDEKTLRPIARLKEPRDLFALPKDKDNDCSQQAPRWPIECQVCKIRAHTTNILGKYIYLCKNFNINFNLY
ncbi:cytosolic carboxypeptidase Nna1-like [Lucilia cuprina]|uniref:cytosolic carboxypeptidase Nna1-like n=1 Tax=Lucilia cuprina TaxID=7375 RepID=UPI001F065B19|nr:cytosolic carboxypeptidase Nna1-like [Lucilia cuprina]